MAKRGSRAGAAAFLLGLSLAGPHTTAVATADGSDTDSPPGSSSARQVKAPPVRAGRVTGERGRTVVQTPSEPEAEPEPDPAAAPRARRAVPAPSATSRTSRTAPSAKGSPASPGTSVNDGPPQPLPSAAADATAVTAQPAREATAKAAVPRPGRALVAAVPRAAAAATGAATTPVAAAGAGCPACWGAEAPTVGQRINTVINHLFNSAFDWISTLPGSGLSNLLEGALILVRRSLFLSPLGVTTAYSDSELSVSVNTGSVAYFRQDGTSLQVSGLPTFRRASSFDDSKPLTVTVANEPGNAGCAGVVVQSGVLNGTLATSQIDSLRFGSGAAFTGEVQAKVSGGPLMLRDAVRSQAGVVLDAPVVLASDVEVDGGSKYVTFTGTVDAAEAGRQSLAVTALGTTTFGAAVGGLSPLASLLTRGVAPLSIDQSADSKTVPLHYSPFVDAKGKVQIKYGIDVAVGENPSQLYEFDTGGNSFFAGYNPSFWSNVPLTTDSITVSYTSGNTYESVVANGKVTIGSGAQTVSTDQPIRVGAIITGGNPKKGEQFVFTNPDAPPVDGNFFGDFGASFAVFDVRETGQLMASPLLQLPGNLSTGFLVQLGPIGTTNPQLTVGVTDALRDQFPYAIPVSAAQPAQTYPVSGYPVLNLFGFSPEYSAQKGGDDPKPIGCDTPDCKAPPLPTVIDSGAPTMDLRVTKGTPYNAGGQLEPGANLIVKFPTTADREALEWTLPAGETPSVDEVRYGGSSVAISGENVNTGLNLYNNFDVMFDAQQQVIWLRYNDGIATVVAGSVTTTGDQTFRQNAQLGGEYHTGGGDFAVGGVTELTADTVINADGGDVSFFGSVNGAVAAAYSLDVKSSGATTFTRAVGDQRSLTSLATDAGGATVSAGATTDRDQSFGDDVSLSGLYSLSDGSFSVAGDATLATPVNIVNDSPGGAVSFAGRVDGSPTRGFALAVSAREGSVEFGGNVGASLPLGGLTIDAVGDKATTLTAKGSISLDGGLGNAPTKGLDIGASGPVVMTLIHGGVIQGYTESGVVVGEGGSGQLSEFIISNNGGDGIQLNGATGLRISDNVLLGNGASGIYVKAKPTELVAVDAQNVIDANTIGTSGGPGITIDTAIGNEITSNSIFGNDPTADNPKGIALKDGGNADQPKPEVQSALFVQGLTPTVLVRGTVAAYPGYTGTYTLQVFLSPSSDKPNAQGRQLLGEQTDVAAGEFRLAIDVGSLDVVGSIVTVTATPATGPANTSEFSDYAEITV